MILGLEQISPNDPVAIYDNRIYLAVLFRVASKAVGLLIILRMLRKREGGEGAEMLFTWLEDFLV